MPDCIFCKIVAREIPAEILFENDQIIAIKDIAPQAPHHILILPKLHIDNLYDEASDSVMRDVAIAARSLAEQLFDKEKTSGFRLVCNNGPDGGQTVGHLHFHLLGGRALTWPPG